MSFPKTSRFLWVGLCGVLMLGGICRADESSTDSPSAVNAPFAANIRNSGVIGSEQVRVVNLAVGTNEFGFVVPRGLNLRVDASRSDKITISSADCSYCVTLRIIRNNTEGLAETELTSTFRSRVLSQYEGATGLEEFTLAADGKSGPAFDASWYVGGTTRRVIRMAFIPTQAGTLECSLVADPKKSSEAKSALSTMLLTLRSKKDGKLEAVVLADKS